MPRGTPLITTYFVCAGDYRPEHGRQDLVSVGSAGILTVFTNNGSGIFTSNATLNVGANTGPIFVIGHQCHRQRLSRI